MAAASSAPWGSAPVHAPPRVAFQGARGAFSEQAARLLVRRFRPLPRRSLDAVCAALAAGCADAAVIPVHNRIAGPVPAAAALLRRYRCRVAARLWLPLAQHLVLLPGTRLAALRAVASHPVALAQCAHFFQRHPKLRAVPAWDTAGSVAALAASGDRTSAAIAGAHAARVYRMVLGPRIDDRPDNATCFVLLHRATPLSPRLQ
jgi:prephenate dehydratase